MTHFFHQLSRASMIAFCLALPLVSFSNFSYAEMSSSKAAAKAKNQHGGKVLNVNKVSSKNGRSTYKVKLLLKDGRVKTVTVSG